MKHPRLIALCYILEGDRIFVGDYFDPSKQQVFHRPLGGGVEWREFAQDAVKREFQEEAGLELIDLRFETVLENMFSFDGVDGHEIAMVFSGRFKDRSIYDVKTLTCVEDSGLEFNAIWVNLEDISDEVPLFPDGLLDHILKAEK